MELLLLSQSHYCTVMNFIKLRTARIFSFFLSFHSNQGQRILSTVAVHTESYINIVTRMRNVISYAVLSSQSERQSQSRKMKTSIVICVCLFVVWTNGESTPPPPPPPPPKPTLPAPGGPPQDSNIDKDCLTAPPEGVDPMTCCQLPELLDPKHIDDCEKKVYGSTQAADDQRNDTPFAPHIRVKISIL